MKTIGIKSTWKLNEQNCTNDKKYTSKKFSKISNEKYTNGE